MSSSRAPPANQFPLAVLRNAFLNGENREKEDRHEQNVSGDDCIAAFAPLAAAMSVITSTRRRSLVTSRVMGSICDRTYVCEHASDATDARCVVEVHT